MILGDRMCIEQILISDESKDGSCEGLKDCEKDWRMGCGPAGHYGYKT